MSDGALSPNMPASPLKECTARNREFSDVGVDAARSLRGLERKQRLVGRLQDVLRFCQKIFYGTGPWSHRSLNAIES